MPAGIRCFREQIFDVISDTLFWLFPHFNLTILKILFKICNLKKAGMFFADKTYNSGSFGWRGMDEGYIQESCPPVQLSR